MNGYAFQQSQPDMNCDDGWQVPRFLVIAESEDEARAIVAEAGISGAILTDSGAQVLSEAKASGLDEGELGEA